MGEELGACALARRAGAIVAQARTERFPDWRELVTNSRTDPLTGEQAEQAVPVARELSAALSSETAGSFSPSLVRSLGLVQERLDLNASSVLASVFVPGRF